MNRMETVLVNSAARRALQRFYEVRLLIALGGRTPGAAVAEIGCGAGYGTKLIIDRFGAASVDAVDLDPKMIFRAQRRLTRYGRSVRLAQGSATALARPSYRLLFDHPTENRFTAGQFLAELSLHGLHVARQVADPHRQRLPARRRPPTSGHRSGTDPARGDPPHAHFDWRNAPDAPTRQLPPSPDTPEHAGPPVRGIP